MPLGMLIPGKSHYRDSSTNPGTYLGLQGLLSRDTSSAISRSPPPATAISTRHIVAVLNGVTLKLVSWHHRLSINCGCCMLRCCTIARSRCILLGTCCCRDAVVHHNAAMHTDIDGVHLHNSLPGSTLSAIRTHDGTPTSDIQDWCCMVKCYAVMCVPPYCSTICSATHQSGLETLICSTMCSATHKSGLETRKCLLSESDFNCVGMTVTWEGAVDASTNVVVNSDASSLLCRLSEATHV